MDSHVKTLFDINSKPIHQASGSLPTGSIGQVIAGLDELGKVRYVQMTPQAEVVVLDQKNLYNTVVSSSFKNILAYDASITLNVQTTLRGGSTLTQITASNGTRLQIVSTNANDTVAGSGLRKLTISYLDSNLDRQTETLSLNGTTPVLTTATNIRYIDEWQTTDRGGATAGTVTLKTYPDNVTLLTLNSTSFDVSTHGTHFVPRNKTAIITNVGARPDGITYMSYMLISSKLPTDGRTFVTSTNTWPYHLSFIRHLQSYAGTATTGIQKPADNAMYVIQGPAIYAASATTAATTGVYMTYNKYER